MRLLEVPASLPDDHAVLVWGTVSIVAIRKGELALGGGPVMKRLVYLTA